MSAPVTNRVARVLAAASQRWWFWMGLSCLAFTAAVSESGASLAIGGIIAFADLLMVKLRGEPGGALNHSDAASAGPWQIAVVLVLMFASVLYAGWVWFT